MDKLEEPSEKFIISVSPHIKHRETTRSVMLKVVIALLPITIYGVYIGGRSALIVVVMSIVGCVGTEVLWQKLMHHDQTISDGSALVTGLLLALTLPPQLPFWIPLIGGAVAIALGKQVFGGLGHNIFNPALVGRAVIFVSWSSHMNNSWLISPRAWTVNTQATRAINSITSATPLYTMSQIRDGVIKGNATKLARDYYKPLLLGNPWGCIGETSALLLLIGLALLLYWGMVDWRIPILFVGTVMFISWALGVNPIFAALSGGLLLGACFMATDYVTNPLTRWGKVVFAVGCGIVTVVIRFYSNLPEGVMFAILFMNGFSPLIDRYLVPRTYGHRRVGGA